MDAWVGSEDEGTKRRFGQGKEAETRKTNASICLLVSFNLLVKSSFRKNVGVHLNKNKKVSKH